MLIELSLSWRNFAPKPKEIQILNHLSIHNGIIKKHPPTVPLNEDLLNNTFNQIHLDGHYP